jgi:potassium-transporting ATPase KdpC subunit
MRPQVLPAVKLLAVFTLLFGLVYPLAITGLAQALFGSRADGSLIVRDGIVVGSELQAQAFEQDSYFQPRPSAAGYDGSNSGGSNLGPANPALLGEVASRVAAYRDRNGLDAATPVPVDAVTSSGSGLDPHISVANARLQAPRVARARDLTVEEVSRLVERHTQGRTFGFLGEPRVNVLAVNLDLDATSTE